MSALLEPGETRNYDYCSARTRIHKPLFLIVNLFSAILLLGSAFAAEFSGPVISVLDGDTIEVLHNQHPERIRLSGIDCPEKGQAYGNRAKPAASDLVFGKEVTLQTHGYDRYKRTPAEVFLPDGTNVNHALVKQGWWWWYLSPLSAAVSQRRSPPLDQLL